MQLEILALFAIFIIGWVALQRVILPKMGIST